MRERWRPEDYKKSTEKDEMESKRPSWWGMVRDAQCQSEQDFPRMSIRNGVTDGTKMCGSERVGNCFVLLCVMHTRLGQSLW